MSAIRLSCKQINHLVGGAQSGGARVWLLIVAQLAAQRCLQLCNIGPLLIMIAIKIGWGLIMTIQSAVSGILKVCVAISVLLVGPAIAASPAASSAGSPATAASFPISDSSFKCITEMTHVRHFYVDNLAGNLAGTVKVAQAATGDYPVGSVLQLVPTEVMVKRDKGFNAATRDWEFFELNVSPTSSTIHVRGVQDVNNRFGGNCFTCHVKARPEFDLVCDNNHGCDGIPITRAMSGALQRTDPRCKNPPVSSEDAAALAQLGAIVKALAAAKGAGPSQ